MPKQVLTFTFEGDKDMMGFYRDPDRQVVEVSVWDNDNRTYSVYPFTAEQWREVERKLQIAK